MTINIIRTRKTPVGHSWPTHTTQKSSLAGDPPDEEDKTTEFCATANCATGRLREDRNILEWADSIGYC